jgi:hypothetical protein
MVPVFPPLEVWLPYYMKTKETAACTNINLINSLNNKKLIAKPITKSPSMIDEKLHGHHLKFSTYTVDQLPVVVILF